MRVPRPGSHSDGATHSRRQPAPGLGLGEIGAVQRMQSRDEAGPGAGDQQPGLARGPSLPHWGTSGRQARVPFVGDFGVSSANLTSVSCLVTQDCVRPELGWLCGHFLGDGPGPGLPDRGG